MTAFCLFSMTTLIFSIALDPFPFIRFFIPFIGLDDTLDELMTDDVFLIKAADGDVLHAAEDPEHLPQAAFAPVGQVDLGDVPR